MVQFITYHTFFFVIRYPNSTRVNGTSSLVSGNHVSFSLVVLNDPSRCKTPVKSVTFPFLSLLISLTIAFPQSINVSLSLVDMALASAGSIYSGWVKAGALSPAAAYCLCFGMTRTNGLWGPSNKVNKTRFSSRIAVCLGQTGSIIFLLMFQSLSHSIRFRFFEAPCEYQD